MGKAVVMEPVTEELEKWLKEAFCEILARQLRTGVERLRDVCRSFEGVFWQRGVWHNIRWKAAEDMMNSMGGARLDGISGPLSRVWLVSHSFLLPFFQC